MFSKLDSEIHSKWQTSAAGQAMFEKYGLDADPWMTLIGYFNSLRELGGMKRSVDDDADVISPCVSAEFFDFVSQISTSTITSKMPPI